MFQGAFFVWGNMHILQSLVADICTHVSSFPLASSAVPDGHLAESTRDRRSCGGRPPIEPPMLPCNACYYFVRSEAVADSGVYNTIRGVGGSLRRPSDKCRRRRFRILVRSVSRVGGICPTVRDQEVQERGEEEG